MTSVDNFHNNNNNDFQKVLDIYFSDPLALAQLIKIVNAKPTNQFQNINLPKKLEKPPSIEYEKENEEQEGDDDSDDGHSLRAIEKNDQERTLENLRKAITKLAKQTCEEHAVSSPLLGFHILLFQRLQIIQDVYSSQKQRTLQFKTLKSEFEVLPLYEKSLPTEESTAVVRQLSKALQKSDDKRGLFAKIRKSRSEAVYRVLTKHTSPMSMRGEDISNVRHYLLDFVRSQEQPRKRRTKAVASLFLFGLSQGSLTDLLDTLQCLLSFSTCQEPLSTDTSEEGGFFVRSEMSEALKKFDNTIRYRSPKIDLSAYENVKYSPVEILNDPELNLEGDDILSVRTVFVSILSRLDFMAFSLLSAGSSVLELLQKTPAVNLSFVVEVIPETFSKLTQLLETLLNVGFGNSKDEQQDQKDSLTYYRVYCIIALLRLLRINVEILSLWRRDHESLSALENRLLNSSLNNSENDTFIQRLKTFLLKVLEDPTDTNRIALESPTKSNKSSQRKKSSIKTEPSGESVATPDNNGSSSLRQQEGTMKKSEEENVSNISENSEEFVVIKRTASISDLNSPYPIPESQLRSICTEVASTICAGFTLFYPTHREQSEFFLESLRSVHLPLRRTILHHLLCKILNNSYLYDSFVVKGLGTKAPSIHFIISLVSFCCDVTSSKIQNLAVDTPQNDSHIDEICQLCLKLVLLWQNHLIVTINTRDESGDPLQSLLQYTSQLLNFCERIITSTSSVLPNVTHEANYPIIENVIKQSFVGWLLMPLIQGYIWLLWNPKKSEEHAVIQRICPSLAEFLPSLLASINNLSTLLAHSDEQFEWTIVETDHPYSTNLNSMIQVSFEDALAVAVQFDKRFRTEPGADEFSISDDSTMNGSCLQFSGVDNPVPSEPLLSFSKSLFFFFKSNNQKTDWGAKCSVVPIKLMSWLYELERSISWIGSRLVTWMMVKVPLSPNELECSPYLDSVLFRNGIQSSQNDNTEEGQFIEDLLHFRGEAQGLAEHMSKVVTEQNILSNNELVLECERAIAAAILKHTGLTLLAIKFTRAINNKDDVTVPSLLMQAWRSARRIRMWIIGKRQREQCSYEDIHKKIMVKTNLLMKLNSCTFSDNGDQSLVSDTPDSSSADAFNAWKQFKTSNSGGDVANISKLIINFVQSRYRADKIEKYLNRRDERAASRAESFNFLTQLADATQFPSIKAEIFNGAISALFSEATKKPKTPHFHYMHNTEACDVSTASALYNAFRQFLEKAISGLQYDGDSVATGILRATLDTLMISFVPSDVDWVLQQDLLSLLCPLMYNNQTSSIEDSPFYKQNSISEELNQVKTRAWRIFRMLSIRCVEMIESWDTFKDRVPFGEASQVRDKLETLRDQIFGLLFDELETISQQQSIQAGALEEMLSLMNSLCNSQSARQSLSNSRFQKLLLPLLKSGVPKVQALSLDLSSQLVLSQPDEFSVDHDTVAEHVEVLFSFLGSCELRNVIGTNYGQQQNVISLPMAKDIFVLLRTLLERSSGAWRQAILTTMETSIYNLQGLLEHVKELGMGVMSPDVISKLKSTAASMVLIYGFFYVPTNGEKVKIYHNNVWRRGKLVSKDEPRHRMNVVFDHRPKDVVKVSAVNAEHVIPLTQEELSTSNLNLHTDTLNALCEFIKTCGNMLQGFSWHKSLQQLFSFFWLSSLRVFNVLIDEPDYYRIMVTEETMQNFSQFAQKQTNIMYGKFPKIEACTFLYSGPVTTKQTYFNCKTCKMNEAICPFCIRQCHYGHSITGPFMGEVYCHCGSGEGKINCSSAHKSQTYTPLVLERMETMALRLRGLVPIHEKQKSDSIHLGRTESSQEVNLMPTRFNNSQEGTGYSMSTFNAEVSFSWSSASGFSLLGTKQPISKDANGCYFEIDIVDMGKPGGIALGLSETVNTSCGWPNVLQNSLTLHLTAGTLFNQTQEHKTEYMEPAQQGDTVGCGWNKESQTIFFTKNGKQLGDAFNDVKDEEYFPVILLHGEGATVRPNLGSRFFRYIYSFNRESVHSEPLTPVNEEESEKEDTSKQVAELVSLGYSSENARDALNNTNNNINAAAIQLHKKQKRPVRDAIADQLRDMGFESSMCIKALKLNNDDINSALTWLIEQGAEANQNNKQEEEEEEEEEDHGMCFLGANAKEQNIDRALMDTITECFDPPVDEAFIHHVKLSQEKQHSIQVVNPELANSYVTEPIKQIAGNLCAVMKRTDKYAIVETIDPESGEFVSCSLTGNQLRLPPLELRTVNIKSVKNEVIKIHTSMSTLYCRRILGKLLTNWPQDQSIPEQYFKTEDLYSALKILFLEHKHYQDLNFLASEPYLSKQTKQLEKSGLKTNISRSSGSLIPLFRYLLPPALEEYAQFKTHTSNFRQESFSVDLVGQKQVIRFWGASSICVAFSNLCELPGYQDVLTFYFDPMGRRIAKQIKGPLSAEKFPRWIVIPGDRFWYEFQTEYVREGAGFQFFATPHRGIIHEKLAVEQPAISLASWIIYNATRLGQLDVSEINEIWEKCIKFIMIPFGPHKGTATDSLIHLAERLVDIPLEERPNLKSLTKLRNEFELLISKHQDTQVGLESKSFYRIIEFLAKSRSLVQSDLCNSNFTTKQLHHLYEFTNVMDQKMLCCPSCANSIDAFNSPPRYKYQDKYSCQTRSANYFEWAESKQHTDLIPTRKLQVSPSDWFEHTTWMDQLAIVQEIVECLVHNGEFPEWFLYEIAIQMKQKIVYKESNHPYTLVKDNGKIHFPGARTLYISFDKHSKTHKSERLLFSKKQEGASDLGSFGGDELKDRLIAVHSNTLYYSFESVGDDHECHCEACGAHIYGVRYHCTLCDRIDLCQSCISRPGIHDERHIFLKIRRAVEFVPAALPNLYPSSWETNRRFRGNVHHGIKCDQCQAYPIQGVRYWCENCDNFNLCENCGKYEYKYHNRMHVFLRVVRPLPPKNQLPPNALPYGLVYEKDIDTHWGYLFSVSSADSGLKLDHNMRKQMSNIAESMKDWNNATDSQLVQYIEQFCDGWQSLDPWKLNPTRSQLLHFPLLNNISLEKMRYRFTMLKLINRKISRILSLLNLHDGKNRMKSIPHMVSQVRDRIFKSVKTDAWTNTVDNLLEKRDPVHVKFNRHQASEQYDTPLRQANNTIFNQGFRQLFYIDPELLKRKKSCFKVNFVGEAADDYGGPFREVLNQMCDEIQEESLPLLVRVPNGVHSVGMNREQYMPNPASNSPFYLKWFQFMGLIMAIGLLSKNVLPLDLPSLFWKLLVNEKPDLSDLDAVDHLCYQFISTFRNAESEGMTEEIFNDTFEQYFTTHTADGTEIELFPGGASKRVYFSDRLRFARAVERYRLNEIQPHLEAVRKGLFSLIPPRFFPLFTWKELEMMVCGSPNIDTETLKKHTIYEGLSANSRLAKDFWHVLEKFNTEERSLFLKFIWGRSRLPVSADEAFAQPMKIQKVDRNNPDNYLPLSHTCFFSIELPDYSSRTVLQDKLLYAITNCQAIDTDATAVANEARNSNWDETDNNNNDWF